MSLGGSEGIRGACNFNQSCYGSKLLDTAQAQRDEAEALALRAEAAGAIPLMDIPSDMLHEEAAMYIEENGGCKFVHDGQCMVANFAIDSFIKGE